MLFTFHLEVDDVIGATSRAKTSPVPIIPFHIITIPRKVREGYTTISNPAQATAKGHHLRHRRRRQAHPPKNEVRPTFSDRIDAPTLEQTSNRLYFDPSSAKHIYRKHTGRKGQKWQMNWLGHVAEDLMSSSQGNLCKPWR